MILSLTPLSVPAQIIGRPAQTESVRPADPAADLRRQLELLRMLREIMRRPASAEPPASQVEPAPPAVSDSSLTNPSLPEVTPE
ncbi:MAG: hypothetical protein KDA96_00720, partial [Planctomycetaceae bacterium]|nr:hypothetical protein [Planctomycetaceae bacterium]